MKKTETSQKRNRKKRLSAVLAASLVFSLTGVGTFAKEPAVAKDETVYVNADAQGNAKQITVSEWLKNAGGAASLKDSSDLKNVKNVKGDETFTGQGDTMTWETAGQDIYYQGTSDKELPVTMQITYFLDGREVKPETIVGKSGRLEIRVSYTNHEKTAVSLGGEKTDIYTPFVLVTGMLLPAEQFSNVEVENGRLVSDAATQMAVGIAMPGLKESLGLEEEEQDLSAEKEGSCGQTDSGQTEKPVLNIPESFTVKAEVTDFSMGPTFTMAFPDLFSDLDLGDVDSLEELQEKLEELSDASLQLVEGSRELSDGLHTLQDNYQEFSAGIKTLQDGVGALLSGSAALANGVEDYTAGVNTLADGVGDYTKGTGTLANGVKQYTAGADELVNGVKQYEAGAGKLASGATQYAAGAKTLADGVKTYAGAQGVGQLEAPVNAYVDGVNQLVGTVESLNGVLTGLAGQAGSTSKAEVETLKSGIAAYTQAVGETYTSLQTLSAGLGQLEGGLQALKSQLSAGPVPAGTGAAVQETAMQSGSSSAGAPPVTIDLSGEKADAVTAIREVAGSLEGVASDLSGRPVSAEVPVSVTATAEVDTGAAGSALDSAGSAVESLRNIDLSALDEKTQVTVREAIDSAVENAQSSIEAARGALPTQAEVTVDTAATVEVGSEEGAVQELNELAAALETAAGTVENAMDSAESSVQKAQSSAAGVRTGNRADSCSGTAAAGTGSTAGSSPEKTDAALRSAGGSGPLMTVEGLIQSAEAMKQGVDTKLNAEPGLKNLADPAQIQAANTGMEQLTGTLEGLLDAAGGPALQNLLTPAGQAAMAEELGQLKNGGVQIKGGISQVMQEGTKLTAGADQLNAQNAAIEQGAAQLSVSGGKLTGGADSLKAAGGELKSGADSLIAASGQLTGGAGQLQANSSGLINGVEALLKGATDLSDGTKKLDEGDTKVKDGILQLAEGSDELSEGAEKMDREGIRKLKEEAGDGLEKLLERFDALSGRSGSYSSYAGKAEDMDGSVKFIIETEEIK